MRIGNREITRDGAPYVIAELGVNHDGSVDRALELVDAAKQSGADAIKLQYFDADRLLGRQAILATYQRRGGASDPMDMLRSLQLDAADLAVIANHARHCGLHAIVTVFSVELVARADSIAWEAYKIASPDVINRPLIDSLMRTGRPLIVSTGASTLDEVARTTQWLADYPHILMHCVSAYPVSDERANLAGRHAMLEINAHAIGYSDHTDSEITGAMAVASGAVLLEKHLTYDRSAAGPDHAASLDPAGLRRYVEHARLAAAMLGPRTKSVQDIEQDGRQVSRQSLTAAHDLKTGHVISEKDLTIKRPGTGIEPWRLQEIVGRSVRNTIPRDVPITEDLLR